MKAGLLPVVLQCWAWQQHAATALSLQGGGALSQAQWPHAASASRRAAVSTGHNTVVYVASGGFTGYKFALLSRLARSSPYPIVVGYDTRNGTTIPPMVKEVLSMAVASNEHGHMVVSSSYADLEQKYGEKIGDYLGYFRANPAKLAVMEWFASSQFTYLWHVEDDVWAPSFNQIASGYAPDAADLIIKASSELPFWADKNDSQWRQGDRSKLPTGAFKHCNPAVFRMSKLFAQSVMQSIRESEATNHHELWFPYVVQKKKLSWANLTHTEHVHMNVHTGGKRMCLSDVKFDSAILIAHPIKCP